MGTWVVGILTAVLLQQGPAIPAASSAAPAASLTATLRLSVARAGTPSSAAAATPFGGLGALLAQMLTPEGPVDMTYTVSGADMRAEVDGRLATLPRGTIILEHVGDPSIRVLNPSQKTWYEIPASQNLGALLGAPDVNIEPTEEKTVIAGRSAERYRFTERLEVPSPEGVNLPPDFPKEIQITGDLWTTDAFAGEGYRGMFRTLQAFAVVPGLDALTANGRFPLRLRLTSDFLAGFEVRTEVTSLSSAPPEAGAFTIPSDYQKVQPPAGGGE